MKTPHYFFHDSNARLDEKLVRLRMQYGAAGYGVYFMILERMCDDPEYTSVKDYNAIAFDLRVDSALIKAVVEEYGLFDFTDDRKVFYSKSFLTRMREKDAKTQRRQAAGKASAEARKQKAESDGRKEMFADSFFKIYNAAIKENGSAMKPVQTITQERVDAAMAIAEKFKDKNLIKQGIVNATRSEFLNGRTMRRKHPADIDWILKPDNFLKCIENNL